MAKKVYEEQNVSNIAVAIREKTGSAKTYKTSEMSDGINEVYEAGHRIGYEDGYGVGMDSGIEQGKQAEYDRFWDVYQDNGNRTNYSYAFYDKGWTDENFKPKYPIIASGSFTQVFVSSLITSTPADMDTSLCTGFSNTFVGAEVKTIPLIDVSSANELSYTFYTVPYLETLNIKGVKETCTFKYAIYSCNRLRNLTIEGVIGNDFSISNITTLTADSLKNIINALKDFSGTDEEFTRKLTLSSASKTLLENEGATSPNGNTWLEYITDKCWNA